MQKFLNRCPTQFELAKIIQLKTNKNRSVTEHTFPVTFLLHSFYLSGHWQSGRGDGKAVLNVLSLQQLPVPEKSHNRSLGGNGASFGSGLLPFPMTTLSTISLLSGKGSMRGSNAARSGESCTTAIPTLLFPTTLLSFANT